MFVNFVYHIRLSMVYDIEFYSLILEKLYTMKENLVWGDFHLMFYPEKIEHYKQILYFNFGKILTLILLPFYILIIR